MARTKKKYQCGQRRSPKPGEVAGPRKSNVKTYERDTEVTSYGRLPYNSAK